MNMSNVLRLTPVALAFVSLGANAVEVFNDGTNTAAIKGYFAVDYLNSDDFDEFSDSTSRIGFHFTRDIGEGWNAFAGVEWGTDIVNGGDSLILAGDQLRSSDDNGDTIWERLGFVGMEHEKWGRFSIGKQWSVFYDVTVWTDNFESFGGNASGTYNFGTDGGISGTGRADQALQWKKSYGNFDLGLQVQSSDETIDIYNDLDSEVDGEGTIDNSFAMSVIYNFDMGLSLGFAMNTGEVEVKDLETGAISDVDDEAFAFGAVYGELTAPGPYAALVYVTSENHEVDDVGRVYDAEGVEVMLGWGFDNNVIVYGGLNHLEEDDDDYGNAADEMFELEYYIVGIKYLWKPEFQFYSEYKMEDSVSSTGDSADDVASVGVKFTF